MYHFALADQRKSRDTHQALNIHNRQIPHTHVTVVLHSQTAIFSFILGPEKKGSDTSTIQFLLSSTLPRVGDDRC